MTPTKWRLVSPKQPKKASGGPFLTIFGTNPLNLPCVDSAPVSFWLKVCGMRLFISSHNSLKCVLNLNHVGQFVISS